MRRFFRNGLVVMGLVAGHLILLTGVANAGTVGVVGKQLRVDAQLQISNDLSITLITVSGVPTIVVDELQNADGLNATPPHCQQAGGDKVHCAAAGITSVRVQTFDEADRITKSINLPGYLFGGEGNDTIVGGPSTGYLSYLYGQDGDDRLFGGADHDVLDGGPGADRFSGGAGTDVADYGNRHRPVIADNDGAERDDGEVNEFDTILTDVENIDGGHLADQVNGNAGPNRLEGHDGDDRLGGLDGNDVLIGGNGLDTMVALAGDDILQGVDGAPGDWLNGGAGVDTCNSDPGDTEVNCER